MADLITITSLRELDALVAERVLKIEVLYDVGNYYFATNNGGAWLPEYSRNMAAAWEIINHLHSQRNCLTLVFQTNVDEPFDKFFWVATFRMCSEFAHHESAAVAICLAALKSVGVEVDLKLGSANE